MKKISVMILGVIVSAFMVSGAYATQMHPTLAQNIFHTQITPYYSYTDDIFASLSFSDSKAECYGSVSPSGDDSVSVTVTLYKKDGSNWRSIHSWSGSASGGSMASASGSAKVSKGTYKVVVVGNVDGKEYPTKSVTKKL